MISEFIRQLKAILCAVMSSVLYHQSAELVSRQVGMTLQASESIGTSLSHVVLLLSSTGDDSDHERMSEGEYIH
jgi:hypothetical protein